MSTSNNDYLDELIAKAKKSWEGIDVDSYMKNLRDMDTVTIKCRDLMVGDWITDEHGFPMQITNVGEDYAYATFEGNEGDPWEFNDKDDKPEPIPITPEILEKNGFERGLIVPSKFYRNVDNEQLSLCPFSTCYELAYIHWGESDDADIAHRLVVQQPMIYVHTLQHALRLFGLDQLADNFKL